MGLSFGCVVVVILNVSMNSNMREMRETCNEEKEIHQTSCGVTMDRMQLKVILMYPCNVILSNGDKNNYTCKWREV